MPLLIYQGKLNLLDREPMESGILDFCAENGVGFISFSPLAQGLLTDRYLSLDSSRGSSRGSSQGFVIPEGSRMSKGKFLKESMLTPELLTQLRQWNDEATSQGQTLAEHALRWILQQRGVTSVLVGASSTGQLEKNLKAIT